LKHQTWRVQNLRMWGLATHQECGYDHMCQQNTTE
jgi:hypothetical protein